MKKELIKIAKKHSLRLIMLYGSIADGTASAESDIDIAVLPEKQLGIYGLLNLQHDLQQHYKDRDIDLVQLPRVSPLLLHEIAVRAKVLFESKKGVATDFFVYAMNRYFDFEPYFKMEERAVRKQIKELTHAK